MCQIKTMCQIELAYWFGRIEKICQANLPSEKMCQTKLPKRFDNLFILPNHFANILCSSYTECSRYTANPNSNSQCNHYTPTKSFWLIKEEAEKVVVYGWIIALRCDLKSLIQQANENEGMVNELTEDLLLAEIELEKLTPEEHEKLVETFLSFQGREYVSKDKHTSPNKIAMLGDTLDCHHLICGLCGVRTIHGRYEEYCEVVALEREK
jgi:hypothetical protein